MGAHEPVAVEVNHVIGEIRQPDFCLPGNIVRVFPKFFEIGKGGHMHLPAFTVLENLLQLHNTLRRHRAMGGDCLYEKEPVPLLVV